MAKESNSKATLKIIKSKAEFIRQKLNSSKKREYEFEDAIVKDIFDLVHQVNDYPVWVGKESIHSNGLPIKLLKENIYKKKDLIYRVEEILAMVNPLIGEAKAVE